jgi:aspartate kinase
MKVFKFGGASLKDARGVKNVSQIIRSAGSNNLLIVVSAMGKTTDLLEKVHALFFSNQPYDQPLKQLQQIHLDALKELFPSDHQVFKEVEDYIHDLPNRLSRDAPFDQVYDQVVSLGEFLSSLIVYHFLKLQETPTYWLDARTCIATDQNFREGRVDWTKTATQVQSICLPILSQQVIVTQGFVGQTPHGLTTTLGREGSDFSAAIFASTLQAESVTIWKDVPGVMNADPKRLPAAIVFEELPFKEAAEMTYYGANVIHPKTIKPLANKGIPLLVKNFVDPSLPGTRIHECQVDKLPPLIVFKENQCLISCKVTDYSFINEQQINMIFTILTELDIRINVMQNSAISFSFCIDFREHKAKALIQRLQQYFEVYYNTGLTLITVKNYNEETFEQYRKKQGILLEQLSRSTLQVLLKV